MSRIKDLWTVFLLASFVLSHQASAQPSVFDFKNQKPLFDPPGMLITATTAAAAGDISGLEVQAAAGGIYVFLIAGDSATSGAYVTTITAASVFDQAVAAVTPLMTFGSAAPSSVVRTGQDSAGTVVGNGALANAIETTLVPSTIPIFVPVGKFLTVRQTTVNTASVVTVGFVELPL